MKGFDHSGAAEGADMRRLPERSSKRRYPRMHTETKKPKIILALDTPTVEEGLHILDRAGDALEYVKIGPRHFFLGGWSLVEELKKRGKKIFLDLKLHDIPNTVAIGVDVLARKGLWALSVHAGGGREMLARALQARNEANSSLMLLGISVLTSMDQDLWNEVVPSRGDVREAVLARAQLCASVKMDGLVCSPKEVEAVRETTGNALKLVIPGIRPAAGGDDQRRTATPAQAVRWGADYLVVGRPIYGAANPEAAFRALAEEIEEAISE